LPRQPVLIAAPTGFNCRTNRTIGSNCGERWGHNGIFNFSESGILVKYFRDLTVTNKAEGMVD